jgi:hypothetical protein
MVFSIPLRLGPFVGGLNTEADPAAIAPTELAQCTNFELDLDASLKTRPPITTALSPGASVNGRIIMLGVGVFSSGTYLIGSDGTSTLHFHNGVWTVISATFGAVAAVQYGGGAGATAQIYLLAAPGAAKTLASWDPVGGFATVTSANLDTMLPGKGGGAMTIFKERLYIVPGTQATQQQSRVVFSDAGAPTTFTASTQFVDIEPGDGQALVDLHTYTDNLLLFKENSTFLLSYTSLPANADVIVVNRNIGVTDRQCVVSYENSVFVLWSGKVYEMTSSYGMNRINIKVPFVLDNSAPSTRKDNFYLCLFGDRLMIRWYNKLYVYGLKTRAWTTWVSADTTLHNFGRLIALPNNTSLNTYDQYYAGSSIASDKTFFKIQNGYDATTLENNNGSNVIITSSLTTKNDDAFMYRKMIIDNVHSYKKMKWWGCDTLTANSVTGIATPIAYGTQVTWGSLFSNNTTWSQLNTWAAPTTNSLVQFSAPAAGAVPTRVFIKFPKSLRYRQINFQVIMTSSGATTDGPAKMMTITVIMALRQTVSKTLS